MATIDLKDIRLEQRLRGVRFFDIRFLVFPAIASHTSSRNREEIRRLQLFREELCYKEGSIPFESIGRGSILTSNPSSADGQKIKRLLGQAPAIGNACDLDLLLFLQRHPRALLTSEQLAAFVGYDIREVAKSLETFIAADLLERTQNPMHAARMYVLVLDGPQNGGIRELLKLASTRNGRHSILQALDPGGSQPETEAPQRKRQLLKIA
jgi:hypothetical protein